MTSNWLAAPLIAALAISEVAPGQDSSTVGRGAAKPQEQPVFQLRMARETAAPGFTRMEFVGSTGGRSGTTYVADSSIVSDEGIERIWVRPTASGFLLVVQFTPQGAARLAAGTAAGIGEQLATLLDSRLVASALIVDSLTNARRIPMEFELPKSSADSIAARILAKWPRRRSGERR